MRKIIVLDFDGVMNNDRTKTRHPVHSRFTGIDPANVLVLNHIVELSGADIVVSSDWRDPNDNLNLQKVLDDAGFIGKVIGKTDWDAFDREIQIDNWLAANITEPFDFVIIDDLPLKHANFVRTNPKRGLIWSKVPAILAFLKARA